MGKQRVEAMVIKTETCSYSGFKVWPGRGKTYVRMDQKMFRFVDGKSRACLLMKRRNLTTKWTAHYRRINKKGISADEAKKRRSNKKSTTIRRDIAGLDPALLAKAKAARPAKKNSAVAAAKKDLAGRKGAKK